MEKKGDKSFDNFDTRKNQKNFQPVMRQCCIQKKIFPRTQMVRLVKTPDGSVFVDVHQNIAGRGIHFFDDQKTTTEFWNPRRRKMVAHFLRAEISEKKWEELANSLLLNQ